MDLEKLNKSQIVLLTLLVSFVTSIATGIVTVALMEQAPPAITQTVNRVVERTIEKVAPEQVVAAAAGAKTETVIIRESDLLATAIDTVAPSVVRLYTPGADVNGFSMQVFVGLAVVTDTNGTLIADRGTPAGPLTAVRTDGLEVSVSILPAADGASTVRLHAASSTSDGKAVEWKPAKLSSKSYGLGKAVVAIGGMKSTRIAQGIITGSSDTQADTTGLVETDISADAFAPGSPLIDADGNIIAIATRESRTTAPGGFLASSKILLQNTSTEGSQGAP
jgi:hypothetical protein